MAIPIISCAASVAMLVLASPPFDLWPLAFISLIPLYLNIRKTTTLRAAGLVWLVFFVSFIFVCYWWTPLLITFAKLSMLSSLGVMILVCLYQSFVYAPWALACSFLNRRFGLSWLLTAPLLIVPLEVLFPFIFKMYLSITVWRAWPITQIAELGGPPAVSAVIILGNLILAHIMLARWKHRAVDSATKAAAAFFIIILVAGFGRALHISSIRSDAAKLKVGLLQPNFGIVSAQERKLHGRKYIKALRKATIELDKQGAELIVWPESSWPYLFDRKAKKEFPPGHPWAFRPGVKGRLFFGSLTHTFGGQSIHNSAVLLSESGEVRGIYDKVRLVPFGEYIPFADKYPQAARCCRERLPDWPEITRGKWNKLLVDKKLRIGPLICSEDLYMDFVHELAKLKPNLMVAIASDAWFGGSSAARQHLALASFRAIETRRDLIRDTNTGISAIIDAVGRVQLEGPLLNVPVNNPQKPTLLIGEAALLDIPSPGPYAIKFFPFICLAALLVSAIIIKIQNQQSRIKS